MIKDQTRKQKNYSAINASGTAGTAIISIQTAVLHTALYDCNVVIAVPRNS